MKRLVSGSVLVMALASSVGCAAPQRATVQSRHVLPKELSQVALEDFDRVSFLEVDLHTAVQTREAVESEFHSRYGRLGHPRWFFHAFDAKYLDFVVARFDPIDPDESRYVAERRIRVKRTREAERALGVMNAVRDYDLPLRVKPGVPIREITAAHRRPVP